nr:PHP domain-containing protein [Acidaminobacter sp. JC074]
MHVHSKEYSACSSQSIYEQVQAGIDKGLDGLVFTNHHKFLDKELIEALNESYAPFKVFNGIEITVSTPRGSEDILVIGLHDKRLESSEWIYEDLHEFVTESGGFIGLAHPYRFQDYIAVDVENFKPHAIEVSSSNLKDEDIDKRISLANKLSCHIMSNSDGHHNGAIGSYFNIFLDPIANEKDLVQALIGGRFMIKE